VKPDPQRLQPLLDLPPQSIAKELKRVSGMFSYYSKCISNFSEKASPLLHASTFPLDDDTLNSFQILKDDLAKACLSAIGDDLLFEVETDASDFALAAILPQDGRPMAFTLAVAFRVIRSRSTERNSKIPELPRTSLRQGR